MWLQVRSRPTDKSINMCSLSGGALHFGMTLAYMTDQRPVIGRCPCPCIVTAMPLCMVTVVVVMIERRGDAGGVGKNGR